METFHNLQMEGDVSLKNGRSAEEIGGEKQTRRLPKSTTKILRRWFTTHSHHPYPSDVEKAMLQEQTGLSHRQISNWFTNARRRSQTRSSQDLYGGYNPLASASISVPNIPSTEAWEMMDPMSRWRNSPPDEEPASLSAIANAVANSRDIPKSSLGSSYDQSTLPHEFSLQARSETSFESLNTSGTSATSSDQSGNSFSSFASLGWDSSRHRRRQQRLAKHRSKLQKSPQEPQKRIYQCTFCTDTFKTKYDWTRHEGSLHLVLEKWMCAPNGPRYQSFADMLTRCTFCDEAEPSDPHFSSHGFNECEAKPLSARTFHRKDHLRQHLRLVHNIKELRKPMLGWKMKMTEINSRCGFCGERFRSWTDRNEHIAEHFRDGMRMRDWKGDRGLDPAVTLLVENAMPPYLIGAESNEFEPFSASKAVRQMHGDNQNSENRNVPTMFENLTARLTEFVMTALRNNMTVTDESVRKQARLIMFGDDDAWNQTPADNAEWLRLFKSGLNLGATKEATCELSRDTANSRKNLIGQIPDPSVASIESDMTLDSPAFNFADYTRIFEFQPGLLEGSTGSQQDLIISEDPCSLPLAWQTPECLAELRQVYESSKSPFQPSPEGFVTTPSCQLPKQPDNAQINLEKEAVSGLPSSDTYSPVQNDPLTDSPTGFARENQQMLLPSLDETLFSMDTIFDEYLDGMNSS